MSQLDLSLYLSNLNLIIVFLFLIFIIIAFYSNINTFDRNLISLNNTSKEEFNLINKDSIIKKLLRI